MKRFRIDIFFHCILVIIIIILVSPLNNEFLNFEILIYLQCLFEVLNVCISSIILYDALKERKKHVTREVISLHPQSQADYLPLNYLCLK